ncbi:MAG TPA: hypothetical protein VNZ53_07940 [Steroidobacteraceae bacterium]|nr:hypothetical protein [Steroidobacteraceae bacterium]
MLDLSWWGCQCAQAKRCLTNPCRHRDRARRGRRSDRDRFGSGADRRWRDPQLIRGRQPSAAAVLCAFDLLELDGDDLRREPIETRKSTLKSLLRGKHAGIAFNAHFIADGAIVYRQACALGCEGIVSKRIGSPYRSGRADCWIKVKNPAAPAVTREAEEDWNGKRNRNPGGNQ